MTTSFPGTWAVPNYDVDAYVPGTLTGAQDILWPTAVLTSPDDAETVSGDSVSLAATVTDPNDDIASVQFRVDGENEGAADTEAPFAVVWDSTAVDDGDYVIDAIAVDDEGHTVTTASITVTVDNS